MNKCVRAVILSNFSRHYLRNRSTLDIGVLGYIGVLYHKEHSPEVWHIPPGTPCIRTHINTFFAQSVNSVVSFYMFHPTSVLHKPTSVYTTFTVTVVTSWTHFNLYTVPDAAHSSSLFSHNTSTFGAALLGHLKPLPEEGPSTAHIIQCTAFFICK